MLEDRSKSPNYMRTTRSFDKKDEKTPRVIKKANSKIDFNSYMGLNYKGKNSFNGVVKRVKN